MRTEGASLILPVAKPFTFASTMPESFRGISPPGPRQNLIQSAAAQFVGFATLPHIRRLIARGASKIPDGEAEQQQR